MDHLLQISNFKSQISNKTMLTDLRSDTFTKPGPGMLEAMMNAPVGDDVFAEDPSVNQLEEMAASMFGMEAALYCPTGTMSNQIAIKVHTQPGDEVICEKTAHVYQYEGGGIAFNSGCQAKLLDGDRGRFKAEQVFQSINPDDVHKPRTTLVCVENTSNRGGGSCYELEDIVEIRNICDNNGLLLHLDGARLFNALVAKKQSPAEFGKLFHSISVCLNKGLGCPIGSMLIGTKEFIVKARRVRKVFGGGMRQAGYMAASGIYALKNNIERLEEDHLHAGMIADALREKQFVADIFPVETNIVIFSLSDQFSPKQFCESLKKENILALPISPTQVRFVLHLDVTRAIVKHVVEVISHL
jgi:threonine aldolase